LSGHHRKSYSRFVTNPFHHPFLIIAGRFELQLVDRGPTAVGNLKPGTVVPVVKAWAGLSVRGVGPPAGPDSALAVVGVEAAPPSSGPSGPQPTPTSWPNLSSVELWSGKVEDGLSAISSAEPETREGGGIAQLCSDDEMKRFQAAMGTKLVSEGTAKTYDRAKQYPGWLNFCEWLEVTRPVPIKDPFMRGFPSDSKALLLALYFQALYDGEAASFKGSGLRDEQVGAVKSALLFHFRMHFDAASGGPIFDLTFFDNRVVKDMLKACKRNDTEFHEYVVARKAGAKLPWCWWLMLVAIKLYWVDGDGSWLTAKDIDLKAALLGFMFLFDVGVRPSSITNPGPKEANHCMTRGQGMAYIWVYSVGDGATLGIILLDDGRFPRLIGVVMGQDIWRMSRLPAFNIRRVGYADFQILSTKTIGAVTSATGANPIPEPITIGRRSKIESRFLDMILVFVTRVPAWDWEQFFTRTGVFPLGSAAEAYFEDGTRAPDLGRVVPQKGIRRLTSNDLSALAKATAKAEGLDASAFSCSSGRKARATSAYHRSVPLTSNLAVPSPNERAGNWAAGSTVSVSHYAAKLNGEGEFAQAKDDMDLEYAGREDTLRMLERRLENGKATLLTKNAKEADIMAEEGDETEEGAGVAAASVGGTVGATGATPVKSSGKKPKASPKKSTKPKAKPKATPKAKPVAMSKAKVVDTPGLRKSARTPTASAKAKE
jgi:hypothetical protein